MKSTFALVLWLILTGSITAQNLIPKGNFWDKRGYFLMRIGFVSGENVRLDGGEQDGQPGFTFGAALEFRILKQWHLGIGGDIHRMHIADSGQYLLDISASLKRMIFGKSSKVGLRPGIAAGYGTMDYFKLITRDRIERSHYFIWKGTFEVIFFDQSRVAPYLEAGLMGTAFGGNREHDLRFGPFPHFRAGLMF